METMNVIAGIAWDPGIRGILIVLVGVVVLMGSTYLILATNVGARLGFLVALTGLFGWMVILTLIWWLTPPAIGPRGNIPTWKPVEIYVNGGGTKRKPMRSPVSLTQPLCQRPTPSSPIIPIW